MKKFLDDERRFRGITRTYTVVTSCGCFHVLANSGEHAYERVKNSSYGIGCLPYAVIEGEHKNLIIAYPTIRL